jgi:hypothetical protein
MSGMARQPTITASAKDRAAGPGVVLRAASTASTAAAATASAVPAIVIDRVSSTCANVVPGDDSVGAQDRMSRAAIASPPSTSAVTLIPTW